MLELSWFGSQRQNEADEAVEPYLLYGGAKGGGKSWWLCRWAFEQCAKYPGNRGFLGRKRGVDFNNTTLETWRKAIPSELYRVNEQKKKIFIDSFDSFIDYGGMDKEEDINKFNSAEYGFVGVDQAEEISRDNFGMLRGTLRHKLPTGELPPYQIRLTANPAQCWLKDDFIANPKAGHRFIKALPTDNPFLADGYIANLEEAFKHRPELLEAYLYGSWDEVAGADIVCQPKWVRAAQAVTPVGRVTKRVVVCDPAHFGDDETVIYVLEASSAIEVIDTEIVSHKTTMDTAGRIMAKRKQHDANLIVIDAIGIGAGIAERLHEQGESVFQLISSRKPTTESAQAKYFNLRAQVWLEGARKIFEGKVALPDDEVLANQLSSVHYEYVSNGKFKIESKEDIKAEHSRSPDRADALMMGIFGLDIADPLTDDEEKLSGVDRQGRGTPINQESELTYCHNEY